MSDLDSLEYVSQVQDLVDLCEFMQDDDLQDAIDLALKFIVKPNVPYVNVSHLVLRFQAYSFKFHALATTYTTIKKDRAGTDNNHKKNIYYSIADNCDKLASALKYIAREVS